MSRTHIRHATRRAAAILAATLTLLLTGIGAAGLTAAPAYAASYAASVYTSPSSTTTGNGITWVATNNSNVSAWVTLCTKWGGSVVAQSYVSPGGSLQHTVTEYSATTKSFTALVPHENSCTDVSGGSASGTWTSSYQPPSTTTTTTRAQTYSVSGSAANTNPDINTQDLITGTNTGSGYEYITLCAGGSAIAEGGHSPGGSLTHDVTSSTGGSKTWYLYANNSYGCSGPSSAVTIDWHNTATVTADPTSNGGHSGSPISTSVSWLAAKTGDTIYVVETDHNGVKEYTTKYSGAASGYSGSTTFTATETPSSGTTWTNDYKAEIRNSSGTVLNWEAFTFTWSGNNCASDTVSLSKYSSTELEATATSPVCLPTGSDSLQVYWSPTQPSSGGTIPLLTEVGSCSLGTGPKTIGTVSCKVSPASPHNSGWYEAYIIQEKNGSNIVVACSGNVELSTAASGNTYALSLSSSNPTPTVGQTINLLATNTAGNPEWLNVCGTTGTTDQGSGYVDSGNSLSHSETSSTSGTVNYIAYAAGSEGCSGQEKTVSVDWQAKPSSSGGAFTPSLYITASNYTPTVGQSVTLDLTNTASGSEWLDYCGESPGTSLTAAGNHSPGGVLTTSVTSSSSGDVTYYGWAGTAEGCSSVNETVTISWQPVPTTTTTTTQPPYSGGGGTTTTTQPSSTTTVPPSSTTGTSGSSGGTIYPTDIHWPTAWPVSGTGSDGAA